MSKAPYLQTPRAFPVMSILHQTGCSLRLTRLYYNHLKCVVYITNYTDLDQHRVTWSHHYGIIECFHCPQNLLYSIRPSPHTPTPATTDHFAVSIILPCPERHSLSVHLRVHVCVCVLPAAQSRPTLCNPMNCSPKGSSVHGIFQARILE